MPVVTRLAFALAGLFRPVALLLPLLGLTLLNDGGDGGEGDGTGDGDGDPAGDGPGGEDGADTDPAGDTFTQDQLDEIIGKRLAREKAKWEKDAKEAAAREQMDETERLKAEKADAEQAASQAREKANQRAVNAEARVSAIAAGVPKDQIGYVLKLADLTDIDVDDDGDPDTKAIDKAIAKVLADIPALKGTAQGSRSGGDLNGGGDTPKPKTIEDAVAQRLAGTA